jgi:hypothetical protein
MDADVKGSVTIEIINKAPSLHLFDRIQQWLLQILFLESFPKFLTNKLFFQYIEKKEGMVCKRFCVVFLKN